MATTSSEREREALTDGEVEALIKEARDRQRRRRRRIALAIAVAAAIGAGVLDFGGARGSHPHSPAVSSSGAIRAFLADAEQAAHGAYSETYTVTVSVRCRSPRVAVVSVSQVSEDKTVYRETPTFAAAVTSPSSPVAVAWTIHSYEVFTDPTGSPRGIVTCTRQRASSPWSCLGPYTGIAMGETNELLGAYPPQALVRGLRNASATYTGKLAIKPEPAYLLTRRVAGRKVRCLQFGRVAHPLGSACLNPEGVIASYQLSPTVTFSTYSTATLQSYSTNVSRGAFSLPAKPKPFPRSP